MWLPRYALHYMSTLQTIISLHQFSTLILNDIQSPGLSVMQNLEIPLIVNTFHLLMLRSF
jgi:hypothetical protein